MRSNEIEQLEFKLEKKILGFRNMQEKLENIYFLTTSHSANQQKQLGNYYILKPNYFKKQCSSSSFLLT